MKQRARWRGHGATHMQPCGVSRKPKRSEPSETGKVGPAVRAGRAAGGQGTAVGAMCGLTVSACDPPWYVRVHETGRLAPAGGAHTVWSCNGARTPIVPISPPSGGELRTQCSHFPSTG